MKIETFQSFVRLKLLARKNLQNDIERLNAIILNIAESIDKNYKSNKITCETFVLYTTRLEQINTLLIKSVKTKYTIREFRQKLEAIIIKLKILVESSGIISFLDILYLLTGYKGLEDDYLNMVDAIFVPTNFVTYRTDEKYCFKNKKECLELYDQHNIKRYSKSTFLNLYKETSIDEIIYGSRYYYYIDELQLVVVCNGYFVQDTFDNYRTKYFGEKFAQLGVVSDEEDLHMNPLFYRKYLNQLSLKEFLVSDKDDILLKFTEVSNMFNTIKTETISSLVKTFLSCTPYKQRQMLISLFLDTDSNHYNYLSFLLFDLINNDSFILKATPVSAEIYNSFHWIIKKKFRINFNKYKQNDSGRNFNENALSYEKRINLMNTDEHIKSKAFSKLKEIETNKTDSSKATQYLEGLLKIPFGIVRKESIFMSLEELVKDFNQFIHKYKLNNHSKLQSRNDIVEFIDNYAELKNSLIDSIINDHLETLRVEDYKVTELFDFMIQCNYIIETPIVLKKEKKSLMFSKLLHQIRLLPNIVDKINVAVLFGIDILEDNNELHDFEGLNTKWESYKSNIRDYITTSSGILNKAIYKQDAAKNEIIRIIGQWINGKMSGYCLGFEGPPGVGKTTFVQKGISQCLKDTNDTTRPFSFIQMGGTSQGSVLEGHGYTYQGSRWGKLVDILMDSKCMNPIIYIDELDKISNTETGRELIGILTHITDRSQNKEFEDKYFSGIKIDLSQILFIFSYNDPSLIDRVLMDRIHRIQFSALTNKNKIHIINHFSLPEILEDIGLSPKEIVLPDEIIEYLINTYTNESGIRKLKERLYEVLREINIRNLKQVITYPYTVDMVLITDIFKNKSKLIPKMINTVPRVGLVNGLYATNSGVGGITIIEIFKTIGEGHLSMHLTGKQGDVMKESMNCSRTLAWNLLPDEIKEKLTLEGKTKKWSFHIHCPDTATPKDGPSAGAAITLALISLMTNTPILNTIALTGEIDLNGNVNQIGGLSSKIEGGKKAGVKLLLFPESNSQDIEIIRLNEPQILENIELRPVKNIWQVLEACLVQNSFKFTKFN